MVFNIYNTQAAELNATTNFAGNRTPVIPNIRSVFATFGQESWIKCRDQLFRTNRFDKFSIELSPWKRLLKLISIGFLIQFTVSGKVNKVVSAAHSKKKYQQVFQKFGSGFGYFRNLIYCCIDKVIDLIKKHLCFVLVCTTKQMLFSFPMTRPSFVLLTSYC